MAIYLVETTAPDGSALLAEPVKFDVSIDPATNQYVIAESSGGGSLVSVTGEGNNIVLTIADVTLGSLPKTGGIGIGLFVLIGVGLICGAGVLGVRQLRAKR